MSKYLMHPSPSMGMQMRCKCDVHLSLLVRVAGIRFLLAVPRSPSWPAKVRGITWPTGILMDSCPALQSPKKQESENVSVSP